MEGTSYNNNNNFKVEQLSLYIMALSTILRLWCCWFSSTVEAMGEYLLRIPGLLTLSNIVQSANVHTWHHSRVGVSGPVAVVRVRRERLWVENLKGTESRLRRGCDVQKGL